jgi:hypothetical protein
MRLVVLRPCLTGTGEPTVGMSTDGPGFGRLNRLAAYRKRPVHGTCFLAEMKFCHAVFKESWLEREIPSFRIRVYKVVRLIPNRTAAPFGPIITPRVCCSVLKMCSRFTSSRVADGFDESICAADLNLASGQRRVRPDVRITLHSMKFSSSRMFPGQG